MSSEKEKIRNILVVAITRMGDMLQASPTLAGFKRQYPDARVTVVIEKQFSSICKGIPGIDEVYELDLGFVCRCLAREQEGIVDAYKYLGDRINELREREFDFCLNMSSSGYTALLLKMLNIPDCRGWISDEEGFRIISSPWAMLFSAFVYHSNRDYNSINLVDIFRCAVGITEHPTRLVYTPSLEARSFAEQFVENEYPAVKRGTGGPYKGGATSPLIAIQAGASQGKRQWSPAKFAALIRVLRQQLDARIVLTGSNSELPIIQAICSLLPPDNITIAAGKTSVDQLAGLLESVDVLITGDTGPMHLSVAVETPVVAIFLASALCFETGPYSEGNIVLQPQISCNPCNPNFPCARPDCHDQISPELVAYLTKVRLENKKLEPGQFEVPASLADPREVAVYLTTFDRDRFLEFKQVNGVSPRHGRPGQFYSAARDAYRELWKTEFLPAEVVHRTELPATPAPWPTTVERGGFFPEAAVHSLQRTVELTNQGSQLLDELLEVIRDRSKPARLLGELNRELDALDKTIEEVGLGTPILGALMRIFVMEKENMRGEDPIKLASEMKRIYGKLQSRIQRFAKLYDYHQSRPNVGQ